MGYCPAENILSDTVWQKILTFVGHCPAENILLDTVLRNILSDTVLSHAEIMNFMSIIINRNTVCSCKVHGRRV